MAAYRKAIGFPHIGRQSRSDSKLETDVESPSQSNHLRSTAWGGDQLVRRASSAPRALYRNRRLRLGRSIHNHRLLSRFQIGWRAANDSPRPGSLMDLDSGWGLPRRLRLGAGWVVRRL